MNNIVEWWLNAGRLNDMEMFILSNTRSEDAVLYSDKEYKKMESEYFSRMPFSNISSKTHNIMFDTCATNHIKNLFKKYVNEDTLVITSMNEHNNVKELVNNCNNKLILNHYKDIITLNVDTIVTECKKYKKAFIYIIGTQISSGEITPQLFYETLKKQLVINNIEHIMVLDDVQGMFMVPRDYSIFDYVVGTAHALIEGYDMGILISRNNDFGIKAINWGYDYLELLDIMLKRKDLLNSFTQVMTQYFHYDLIKYGFSLFQNTAPHIFAIKTNGMEFTEEMHSLLDNYCIRLEGIGNDYVPNIFIRMRAQQYIKFPETCIDGLKVLHNLLEEIKDSK